MKTIIENRLKELKTRRAQLDGELKNANDFIQHAIPEMNGLNGAIAELEGVLNDALQPTQGE